MSTVQVNVADLEVIRAACNSAYFQNTALDLLDSYRKLNQRQTPSNLSKALQGAVGIVDAYLAAVPEDEEDHVS